MLLHRRIPREPVQQLMQVGKPRAPTPNIPPNMRLLLIVIFVLRRQDDELTNMISKERIVPRLSLAVRIDQAIGKILPSRPEWKRTLVALKIDRLQLRLEMDPVASKLPTTTSTVWHFNLKNALHVARENGVTREV